MYIRKQGNYQYLEEKGVGGKILIKFAVGKVKKILYAFETLTESEKREFLARAYKKGAFDCPINAEK